MICHTGLVHKILVQIWVSACISEYSSKYISEYSSEQSTVQIRVQFSDILLHQTIADKDALILSGRQECTNNKPGRCTVCSTYIDGNSV